MKTVLFIAYHYPPYLSAAALRSARFARLLPDFGWRPIVLTAESEYPATLRMRPPAPVYRTRQISIKRPFSWHPGDKRPVLTPRAKGGSLKSTLYGYARAAYRQVLKFPDGEIGWYPFAVGTGRRIIERERPDIILSAALPATSLLVASRLSRETGVPWVADLRDLWTDNHDFQRIEPLRTLERGLERRVLRTAAAIVTVSQPLADLLGQRIGRRVEVVTNGYDPDEFAEQHVPPTPYFSLTYTGTFYPEHYDAEALFAAIAKLAREGAIAPDNFRVRFAGAFVEALAGAVQRAGAGDFVSLGGVVPREESLRMQAESTALLFFAWRGPRGEGAYSAKIFEYLGGGRPILSIGPLDNVASKLIELSRAGVAVQGAAQVEATLRRWLTEFRTSGAIHLNPNTQVRRAYEWPRLVEQLAAILERASLRRRHA